MTAPNTAMRERNRILFKDFFVANIVDWKKVHLICVHIYSPYQKVFGVHILQKR